MADYVVTLEGRPLMNDEVVKEEDEHGLRTQYSMRFSCLGDQRLFAQLARVSAELIIGFGNVEPCVFAHFAVDTIKNRSLSVYNK